jgi:hypothetical protein
VRPEGVDLLRPRHCRWGWRGVLRECEGACAEETQCETAQIWFPHYAFTGV